MNITGYAFITGAGSGIGKACGLAYATEGAAGVYFTDINEEAAEKTAEESKMVATNPNYRAFYAKLDVTNETGVTTVVEAAVKVFGRLDYAVNSAGVGIQVPAEIAEASVEEFERFQKVNVLGTMLCVRAQSRVMKAQEPQAADVRNALRTPSRGVIINLGSANSHVATRTHLQYTTSKHAVLGLTKNAALDNVPYNIRVNCVCPTWVDTPMVQRAVKESPQLGEFMKRAIPMGRIAQTDEVSDVVMFLSSQRSSYITGCGWLIDGGAGLQVPV